MIMSEAEKIIERIADQKGVRYEKRQAVNTASVYYTIYSGESSLMFRVSDHPTKDMIITLRTDCGATYKVVADFMEARCRDLDKRRLNELLGLRIPPSKLTKGHKRNGKQKNIPRWSCEYAAR